MTNYDPLPHKHFTYGVSSTGNIQALQMSLVSVLMGAYLPSKIIVRMEGHFPSFGTYYMEQIAELARHKGVEFSITTAKSQGVRHARDWLIEECRTTYLWMGDDDVLYCPNCLSNFVAALTEIDEDTLGYVNGNKPDLNNRRGYTDFGTAVIDSSTVKTDGSQGYNAFFGGKNRVVKCDTADTGNLLIHVPNVITKGVKFQVFDEKWNAGGEDTLFALMCQKAGLTGWFSTRADSFHLEKESVRFGEFAARKAMLKREAELLCLETGPIFNVFPWIK